MDAIAPTTDEDEGQRILPAIRPRDGYVDLLRFGDSRPIVWSKPSKKCLALVGIDVSPSS